MPNFLFDVRSAFKLFAGSSCCCYWKPFCLDKIVTRLLSLSLSKEHIRSLVQTDNSYKAM